MRRIRAQHDIKSISEFRNNAASLIEQVQNENQPLILTQHGHGAAVVLSVAAYDQMLDEIELLRSIARGERQLERGEGVPHDEAKQQVLARLKR